MVIARQFQRLPRGRAARRRQAAVAGRPALSGGGSSSRRCCHTFDFLDFLFGPVDGRAFADNQAGAYRPEDIVTASLRFASGVYGSGTWCFAADFDEEYNEIIGASGRIRFSTSAAGADPPHARRL